MAPDAQFTKLSIPIPAAVTGVAEPRVVSGSDLRLSGSAMPSVVRLPHIAHFHDGRCTLRSELPLMTAATPYGFDTRRLGLLEVAFDLGRAVITVRQSRDDFGGYDYERLVLASRRSDAVVELDIRRSPHHGSDSEPLYFLTDDEGRQKGWFVGRAEEGLARFLLGKRDPGSPAATSYPLELWFNNHPILQGPFSTDDLPSTTVIGGDSRVVLVSETADPSGPGACRTEITHPNGVVLVHRNYGIGEGIEKKCAHFTEIEIRTASAVHRVELRRDWKTPDTDPKFSARGPGGKLGTCTGRIDTKLASIVLGAKIEPTAKGVIPAALKSFVLAALREDGPPEDSA